MYYVKERQRCVILFKLQEELKQQEEILAACVEQKQEAEMRLSKYM